MTKNWKCGSPACDRPLAWHARRATYLLETEGPDAEREFEMDHPDSEDDDDPACDASDASECAMMRERSVAGRSNEIPACPVHGHRIGGKPIGPDNPGAYGRTHDMDCPGFGCAATPFTLSPRSETYWSS